MRWLVAGSPTGFQEAAFRRYDRVLAEASKRGIRVIIYVTDNWEYGGGAKVWAQWYGSQDKNAFFTDPKIKAGYKNLLKQWVMRKNTVTGINYRDDPAVFAWELCNEPRYEADKTGKTLAGWVDEMARTVKSMDPKHMVSTGVEGHLNDNGQHYSGADFTLTQQPPAIDFATFHFYPIKGDRRFSLRAAKKMVRDYVKISHDTLKKPVIMEEYGVEKKYDGELNRLEWTEGLAEDFLKAGGDGINYWQLTNESYTGTDGFEITKADVQYCNLFSRLADEVNR
jgi:endo-1,4-beta-mannosidase